MGWMQGGDICVCMGEVVVEVDLSVGVVGALAVICILVMGMGL